MLGVVPATTREQCTHWLRSFCRRRRRRRVALQSPGLVNCSCRVSLLVLSWSPLVGVATASDGFVGVAAARADARLAADAARGDSTPASGEGGAAVGDQGFSRRSSLEWVRSSASYPLTSVRRCMLRVNRGKCGPGWAAMVWSVHRRSEWHRHSRCSRGNSERSLTERGSRGESGLGQSCCACGRALKAKNLDSSHDGLID